jgi:DNA end-binding protein Ku
MALHSSWRGFLKLSLVSVPVKAFSATGGSGAKEIQLNQLHVDCNSRIQYKKFCPIHGEVKSDAIVSGFEYSKGQYVIIDTKELDKLRTEDDKAITIKTFIQPDQLDPIYQNGKSYYLVPDGPVGQKPYTLLREGMMQEKRVAIVQLVLHGKEQMLMLRPMDGLLAMSMLNYDPQVVKPSAFVDEAPKVETTAEEMKLVKALIEASTTEEFDYTQFKDVYTEKLTRLIEAKVAGEEIVAPPVHEDTQIINLMDALRESVANLTAEKKAGKPARKMAPSTRGKAAGGRKKKTS